MACGKIAREQLSLPYPPGELVHALAQIARTIKAIGNRSNNRSDNNHSFFCCLLFSMELQSFLLSLLVLNICWSQGFSAPVCKMANWWGAFDRKGWATCDSSTQYIKGLWRNHNGGPREQIYLLEGAKCCSAPAPNQNTPSTCQIANWWIVLDR